MCKLNGRSLITWSIKFIFAIKHCLNELRLRQRYDIKKCAMLCSPFKPLLLHIGHDNSFTFYNKNKQTKTVYFLLCNILSTSITLVLQYMKFRVGFLSPSSHRTGCIQAIINVMRTLLIAIVLLTWHYVCCA